MPPSMRAQTAIIKRRDERDNAIAEQRCTAVLLLREVFTVSKVVEASGVKRATADRLKACIHGNDNDKLQEMLSPHKYRAGRRSVINDDETNMMKQNMVHAAQRGFAFNTKTASKVMANIAADGRRSFTNNVPSPAAIRSWRARNRDVTLRKSENKEAKKLLAENFSHVNKFAKALKTVERANPEILDDLNRFWNMDETEVDATQGSAEKGFGSTSTNRGGFKRSSMQSNGRHVTAIIFALAAGRVAPPFFYC